jgi:hypothetical protein
VRERRTAAALGSLGLLVLATIAGCAGDPASPRDNVLSRETIIDADAFVEANLAMNASAELAYEWSTNGTSLAFDVHTHTARGLETFDTHNGTQAEGTFTAPRNGTFSIFWTNEGSQQARLSFSVSGKFTVDSLHPKRLASA